MTSDDIPNLSDRQLSYVIRKQWQKKKDKVDWYRINKPDLLFQLLKEIEILQETEKRLDQLAVLHDSSSNLLPKT